MATIGSLYNFYLLQLQFEPENRLQRMLKAVTEVMRERQEEYREAEKVAGHEEGFDDWAVEEGRFIDDLLGIGFVACQVYITEVVSTVSSIHDLAQRKEDIELTTTGRKRDSIMRHAFTPSRGKRYSRIEVIDALANYYKHSDEWPYGWKRLTKHQKNTAKVVKQARLKPSTPMNLARGAAYLGNKDYESPEAYVKILSEWKDTIISAYRKELVRKGLHPSRRSEA